MTHVLNFALKSTLLKGSSDNSLSTCDQKGSLVDEEKLRFDFSWNAPLTPEQTRAVELIVVDCIRKGLPVYDKVVPLEAASKIYSLRMVFGEKYPDPVRVISIGEEVDQLISNPLNTKWAENSIEFCGGTHLKNTNQAEDFVIVEESGIAKGIRRVVGLTRSNAKSARDRAADILNRLSVMEASAGSRELVNSLKGIKLEVDQAVVSLVDKNIMRTKITKINDIIKAWNKQDLIIRTSEANSKAEQLCKNALSTNKVIIYFLLL
jgi:alanyl-tRNA synthetase